MGIIFNRNRCENCGHSRDSHCGNKCHVCPACSEQRGKIYICCPSPGWDYQMKKRIDLWYCQAKKKTGNPVAVEINGVRRYKRGFTKTINGVRFSMIFGNAKGTAKRSGATTILKITYE